MKCKKCLNVGTQWKEHSKLERISTEVKCCHCTADHQAFSRNCTIFKRETEFIQFQTKERIPRLQAIRKLLRLKLNPESIFPNAIKNISSPTRAKSPTRYEQESQSDSSEDTNVLIFFETIGNEEDNSPTVPIFGLGYQEKSKK